MTRNFPQLFQRRLLRLPRFIVGGAAFLALSACQRPGGVPDYPKNAAQKDERHTSATNPKPSSAEVFHVEQFIKIADVAQGSFGPRLHPVATGWIAVWATPHGEKPGWYSSHVTKAGDVSEPLWLSDMTPGLRQFTLGTLSAGEVGVISIRRGGKKEVLEVLRLGPQGALLGRPRLVADSPAAILWADVVPVAQGGLVVWAEREASSADIYSSVWINAGIEKPQRIVRDVYSWQLVSHAGSVALATLEEAKDRRIVVRQLGAQGQTIGAPILVANHVDGGLDLDMAMTTRNIVVAWSQHDRFERRIHRAVLDASGNVIEPAALLSLPRGDQALVHLDSVPPWKNNKGAAEEELIVVWEEPLLSQAEGRTLLVSAFTVEENQLEPQARLLSRGADTLLPMIAASSAGQFALLAEGSSCAMGSVCDSKTLDYVSFFASMHQSGAGAVLLKEGARVPAISMAWDLSCLDGECVALVADNGSPSQVFLAPIREGGRAVSPWTSEQELSGPRMISREALSEVPELVAMSGQLSDNGSALLSWLSYFDPNVPYDTPSAPAPDGKRAPVRARLENQFISPGSSSITSSQVISYRARSLGGVELDFRSPIQGLMVWAALDGDAPQLFATLLDAEGRRVRQKMLTKSSGEVTDVNVTAVDSGYIVAWVESSGNHAEVWAMPLTDQLIAGTPQQLSTGANTPIGLSLTQVGTQITAVWADSRGTTKGHADLFSVAVDPVTAAPLEREIQLIDSELHSHSPRLIPFSSGQGADAHRAKLVWIESDIAPDVSGRASGTLYYADYSATSGLGEAVAVTQLPSALSFSAECSSEGCHVLVATQDRIAELWAVSLPARSAQASGSLRANRLLSLRSNSASATTPLLLGDVGYYADKDESGEKWLLSRVGINWNEVR